MTSRIVSGLGGAAVGSAVWTLGIAKTIVTVRRLSRAMLVASEAPQVVQNRIRSGLCSPQLGQIRIPGATSGAAASDSVRRSWTATSRQASSRSVEPLGLTGSWPSNSAWLPTCAFVEPCTSTSSGGEFCSITVEVSTGSPRSTCWPLSALPNVTSPVATPVRTTSRTPQPCSSSSFRTASARCDSAAASRARSGSSSWRKGSPKTATIASPMIFSMVPPWDSKTARITSK